MPVTPEGHGLGLIPDTHDDRDRLFTPPPVIEALPDHVDLSTDPAMPPIWNQGQLGSCTAHGTLACFLWASVKCGANDPMLSRLMLYYDSRALEGTPNEDSGAQIRDAVKATAAGICPESMWPYVIDEFTVPPTQEMRDAGQANKGLVYERVEQDAAHIKACLADGFPVDIGVTLFESFEAAPTMSSGVVPMPTEYDQPIGGHCMAVVGYGSGSYWQQHGYPLADAATEYVKVRNSWGLVYLGGASGYCLMPVDYLTDPQLGSDYWRITRVS